MKLIDITVPFHTGMANFPGTEPPKLTQLRTLEKDDKSLWKLEMTTITGTHIEAPCHSIAGATCIDQIDPMLFIGPCLVAEVTGKENLITLAEVRHLKADRILFKTGNSAFIKEDKFYDDYTALSAEAAQQLVENGVKMVGIDYYGIERRGSLDHPVHKTLFKAGIPLLVGIDLSKVAPGYYNLVALPLPLKGLDGSPCRAMLVQS
jgi:arylformamidase